jgi:hypothetical protein
MLPVKSNIGTISVSSRQGHPGAFPDRREPATKYGRIGIAFPVKRNHEKAATDKLLLASFVHVWQQAISCASYSVSSTSKPIPPVRDGGSFGRRTLNVSMRSAMHGLREREGPTKSISLSSQRSQKVRGFVEPPNFEARARRRVASLAGN